MANKRITDVDIIDSLNGNESFFVNQNSTLKQINKSNIVFGINNGGTGATTVSGARNALGLGDTDGELPIENGGTGATTVAGARYNLGLGNTDGALPIANGGTGATTVAGIRSTLGLGNTDEELPIANGGTGATTAAAARKNIGAVSMSNAVVVLSASKWSNKQQVVTVANVTADNTVIVGADFTTNNYKIYNESGIYCIGQSDGKLTFSCNTVPSSNITVNITIFS